MDLLRQQDISCPYCGESISVMIDCSIAEQSYVEDCQVCCQPIVLDVQVSGSDAPRVSARQEND
jgi:hypothetical protein